MERMNRRWSTFTSADIQIISDNTPVEKYSAGGLSDGEYMPEFTDKLNKKVVTIRFSDSTIKYTFTAKDRLSWSIDDGDIHYNEYCQIVHAPCEEEIYFVNHYCKKSSPPEAHTLVLDFETGLATVCVAQIGIPASSREVGREFKFGIMDRYKDTGIRHDYTDDLVGTAIYWTYKEGFMPIKHIYSTPKYYTYSMVTSDGRCWLASNPADYIQITDKLYIFSFVEERQAGSQGLFLINIETLHDVGSFFGLQAGGMECYVLGAKGELTTMETYY